MGGHLKGPLNCYVERNTGKNVIFGKGLEIQKLCIPVSWMCMSTYKTFRIVRSGQVLLVVNEGQPQVHGLQNLVWNRFRF